MKLTDAPKKQPVPFASNGQRENILATTPAGDNTASYDAGFPPVTMILKAAGGLPPKGQDMNQILYELSALARWFSAGALNPYDSSFASAIGGYPKGSFLLGDDSTTIYMNAADNNTSNPNTGGGNWFNLSAGYLKTSNNLSEISLAGADAQSSARSNLGLGAASVRADQYFLQTANNLYEILSAGASAQGSARSNLGLGTASTKNTEYFLQLANNLFEIKSAGSGAQNSARTNLGLGTASVQNKEYFLQVANNLYEILGAGSGAQAAARSNLGLGSASTRTVGTTGNQIPDMTNFASSTSAQPYQFFPTGLLIQAGYSTTDSNGNGQISFAQSFVSGRPIVVALPTATSPSNYIATVGGVSNSGCTVYCTAANAGQTPVANAKIGFNYIAFGY